MLFIIIIIICSIQVVHLTTWTRYIAIQQNYETYQSYIPFISQCDYSSLSNTLPGNVNLQVVNDTSFFQDVSYQTEVEFWSPVLDGISAIAENKQWINGEGIVLINSTIYDNGTRQLIIYNHTQNNIFFYYAIPYMNQSGVIKPNIVAQKTFVFSANQTNNTLQNCPMGSLLVSSIGEQYFFAACQNASNSFYWSVDDPENTAFSFQFSFNQLQYLIKDVSSNPSMFSNADTNIVQYDLNWNLAVLTENLSSSAKILYFCDLSLNDTQDQNSSMTFNCIPFEEFKVDLDIIIDRIWGIDNAQQDYKIQSSMQKLNLYEDLSIPGDIVAVYINDIGQTFIESVTPQSSYLIIYNQLNQLQANISFQGKVVLYFGSKIVIQNDGVFQFMSITRPILLIDDSIYPETTLQYKLDCSLIGVQLNFNYQIFWTNSDYPQANITLRPGASYNQSFLSFHQIYAYAIDDYYIQFGPAFNYYLNDYSQQLSSIIIENSVIKNQTNDILTIIELILNPSTNYFETSPQAVKSISYLTSDSLVSHSVSSKTSKTINKNPCGINKLSAGHKANQNYYFSNSQNSYCQCDQNMKNCQQIPRATFVGSFKQSQIIVGPSYGAKYNYKIKPITPINQSEDLIVSKFLISDQSNKGYFVSAYKNNSITYTAVENLTVLSVVNLQCNNTLNLALYMQNFEKPYIFAYCQSPQNNSINQYSIIDNTITFARKIPLYGFILKNSSEIFVGTQFMFLEVEPTPQIIKNSSICCVLRIDPTQFTVSVIKEIIEALDVIQVYAMQSIDIVYFNSTSSTTPIPTIKIYLGNTFIALNQTNRTNPISSYNFNLSFISYSYNFAAMFPSTITFNLTSALINYNQSQFNLQNNLNFPLSTQFNFQPGKYTFSDLTYLNLNSICGPIRYSSFYASNISNQIFRVIHNSIYADSKIIGQMGLNYYQIITLMDQQSYSSLSQLILIVTDSQLFFYQKVGDNENMHFLQAFSPPQGYCHYHLAVIINSTSAQYLTSCLAPNYRSSTPYMTINFENNTLNVNFTLKKIPQNLNTIQTLPLNQSASSHNFAIFGLAQGPMQSLTGKLFICNWDYCRALYVSSRYLFLTAYDRYYYNSSSSIVVISLDKETLQIWLNPQSPTTANLPPLNSSYNISLEGFIFEQLTAIKIVNANSTAAQVILSGSIYYYHCEIIYGVQKSQISILNKFHRYTSCDQYDQFLPKIIRDPNTNQIIALIALCNQNINTLVVKEFETINSSLPVIYTGNLQIFILNGPSCQENAYQTAHIIPISTSMNFPLFQYYQSQGQYRLLFEQVQGILIDGVININPSVQIKTTPLTDIIDMPNLQMTLFNDYYSRTIQILIIPDETEIYVIGWVMIGIFGLFNLITILALCCWCLNCHQFKKPPIITQADDDDMTIKRFSVFQKSETKRPRFTQIELFQRKLL